MSRPRHLPAAREALTLPLLLLSVVLLGSVRVAGDGTLGFAGPTLASLVLAFMLVGLLVQSGLVAPARLMAPERPALANLNGLVVLLTLFAASAQVFTALTPEGGLLGLLFNAFFVAMLWSTAAARPEAQRLLRSLLVVFGWALVLRFVVLNGLAAPEGGLARRVFALALEGLTLGALGLTYHAPATGYAAFAMLALFFVALVMLPSTAWAWTLAGAPPVDTRPPELPGATERALDDGDR